MQKITLYIGLLLSIGSFTACEEVIEVELNEANPQWVVEGQLDATQGTAEVRVSQTGNYFGEASYLPGEGASVSLTHQDGTRYDLVEQTAGRYAAGNIASTPGDQFTLEVEIEGETIVGQATTQAGVTVDSLSANLQGGFFGQEEGYVVFVNFQEPAESDTYLRFHLTVNGAARNDILLYDDGLTNGAQAAFPLFPLRFKQGDEVEVEAWAVDEASYRYFTSLSEIVGQGVGPGAAAPANPTNNLTGNSLGYFTVFSKSEASLKIE
ncbi:MAG: DUF4249 domain-containing protein [Bacteroidota bacterium]